ncbi:MAG: PIN domain-containing protein [Acidobacteria bacterium]|nr:PIN domain-containing protein [Acidobacteriota bacterium]MCI0623369.1 PIN domain-containing protein [Acidobacteriota bacterium]MCI0721604.1 PIN domain-containing protein [Acidobacteriota bacterium]
MIERIYLDTPTVIYSVEQVPLLGAAVDARISDPSVIRIISELTRMECRVKPLRLRNTGLLQDFDDYFLQTVSEIVSLSRQVVDRATEIRAEYGFRTPDSLHLAAALEAACDTFLTNDHRLNRFKDIRIDLV